MPLFDIIKDPDGAEAAVAVLVAREDTTPEPETTSPSEVELLRAAAREVDAREWLRMRPEYPMDTVAETFLAKCLAQAQEASTKPYRYDSAVEAGFRSSLRVVGVVLLEGDWPTVLNGREAALATVRELERRGYGSPQHDYPRVRGQWQLRIRFCY